MKSRKVFIHIGQHKTGSTSIQEFLNLNREILKKKGYIYPDFQCFASHPLAWSLGFGAKHDYYKDFLKEHPDLPKLVNKELNKVFSQKEDIVISSEVFCEIVDPNFLENLKNSFSGMDIKIIYYIRRADFWLESNFRNFVIYKGFNEDQDNFVSRFLSGEISHAHEINIYAKVFGKENIIVRPFEKEQLFNQDLFEDFLNILGLKPTSDFQNLDIKSNCGLNNKAVKLFCLINSITSFSDEQKQEIKQLILSFKEVDFFRKIENFSLFSPHKRIEILEKVSNLNQQIAKDYLGRKDGCLFYEPIPKLEDEWRECSLTDKEIASIFMETILKKEIK